MPAPRVQYPHMSRQTAPAAPAPAVPALIETKLGPPRARPGFVERPRLLGSIDGFASAALTLVDAPVGFGKTSLVESWHARTGGAVAWVSLEAADNDPARLWTYVSTAVDRIRPGLGRAALALLRSPGVSPESVVDALVNGVHAYPEPMAIVLDDVHVISDETCWRSLERLVEHLPVQARLIMTTRSDPPLPLGRLRARGGLGEIRARDLAFSVDEARQLLVQREKIALDDADVELLVERTEGWPAGLYLAALWLRGLDDPHAGVQAFHGNQRHVADYLTGEVLDRLEEDTRRFLLQSSVLGSFTAPLCDAALDRSDSAALLRRLEAENGFLVSLDAHGEWYRYHHLFGELLQLELSTVEPTASARLHTAASAWCREHGWLEDALEHAAAAGDPSAGSCDPRRRAPHVGPHGPRWRPCFAGLPRSRRACSSSVPRSPSRRCSLPGCSGARRTSVIGSLRSRSTSGPSGRTTGRRTSRQRSGSAAWRGSRATSDRRSSAVDGPSWP